MANTKQAQKMIRKTEKRTQFNRWWKSLVKKSIKDLIGSKNPSQELIVKFQKTIDKAVKNHVIHQNKGNRIKSQLMKKLQTTN